ncbi:uncharacterized protein LOC142563494 [Dermacentor variabilis]|uniref:uncharacterized protein LOC142563494 n=1 Tax=Dermacentor variabilis TaxID=34621 RepID=UPI003F5C5525
MAVVYSDCKYTLIDVGAEGRLSDGGTFKNSEFGRALTQADLDIPSLSWLPGSATNAPYAIVGDEAFQLREDFLRHYPARQLDDEKRFFNYRLSRARRCAENAFGITAARWTILLRTIHLKPKNVDFVIKAACILHNFLTVHNPQSHKFTDTEDSFGVSLPPCSLGPNGCHKITQTKQKYIVNVQDLTEPQRRLLTLRAKQKQGIDTERGSVSAVSVVVTTQDQERPQSNNRWELMCKLKIRQQSLQRMTYRR